MKSKFMLSLLLGLYSSAWATSGFMTIELANHQRFHCEIADTPESLSRGLMYRSKLAPNTGMLFIFPYSDTWAFWMKNTEISLDMLWLNQNREVVYIVENAQPCQNDCIFYRPGTEVKAQYVLELKGGQVKAQNIQVGSQLKFLESVN